MSLNTSTTLTREALLGLKPKTETVEIPGLGDCVLRAMSEVTRSRRYAAYLSDDRKARQHFLDNRRSYMVIDQVCDPDGSPMFTERDLATLGELDAAELDPIIEAINAFNERHGLSEKNEQSGLSDTSES